MNKDLEVKESITIDGTQESVWDAMTNPAKIVLYLYGTQTTTDWKVGSPIAFEGQYGEHTYKDKGVVKINDRLKKLTYSYWSSMSGLEDLIENYFEVNYIIEPKEDGRTQLTWHQVGFSNEKGYEHTKTTLPNMLNQIKAIVEKMVM
ncbi:MAG: hypothetical protein ACI86M_002126 [Saprospiraceae bacterium]|jgi:hypothetical protein